MTTFPTSAICGGLARLYEKAVDQIKVMDIPDDQRCAMLAEIEAAFDQATECKNLAHFWRSSHPKQAS